MNKRRLQNGWLSVIGQHRRKPPKAMPGAVSC